MNGFQSRAARQLASTSSQEKSTAVGFHPKHKGAVVRMADGGMVKDVKPSSFGDAAAATQSASVQQVPTGMPAAASSTPSMGAASPSTLSAPLPSPAGAATSTAPKPAPGTPGGENYGGSIAQMYGRMSADFAKENAPAAAAPAQPSGFNPASAAPSKPSGVAAVGFQPPSTAPIAPGMPGGINTNGANKQMYDRMSAEYAKTAQPESTFNLANGGAPYVKGSKDGGRVVGPGTGTSDSVPARYSNGEYVLPADTAAAIGHDKLDQIRASTHTPVAEPARGFKPQHYFANGGMVEDVNKKPGNFGDAAAASQSAAVQQIPTGGNAPAPAHDGRSDTELSRNVNNGLNALGGMGVVSSVPMGAGKLAQGTALATTQPVAASVPAFRALPGVNAALQEGAQANALAGATRTMGNASAAVTAAENSQPAPKGSTAGLDAMQPTAMVAGQESMAGAGRGTAADPRALGDPGSIAEQAKTMSPWNAPKPKPEPVAGPVANPNQITVTRQPNGTMSFSGGPDIGKNGGDISYTGPAGFKPSGFGVSVVPGGSFANGSPSGDAALSAARFAAADRGDFEAVRNSYFVQGQSFGGETKESVASDRLKELALSPVGTPGRKAALQMYKDSMESNTTLRGQNIAAGSARYTADAHVKSQQAANGIAQGKLQIDQAKEGRIAKLDELIMSGNPMQQKMAAAQKAALMGKGWGTAGDQKTAQDAAGQAKDTQDIFGIIDQAEPLLGSATGSYLGAGVDKAAQVFGHATEGAKTGAQLQALQGALVSKMPKMSGPQSDKDVQLYREMAGQIGNATIPGAQRQAALNTIRQLHEKYLPMVNSEADAAKLAPGTTFKGPDGKIRRTAS